MSSPARKSLAFTKYSGAGNDFIIVDSRQELDFVDGSVAARTLCRRGTAIGADGLVLLTSGPGAELAEGVHGRMKLWNADGSAAEFSGNAARCAVRFLFDEDIAPAEVRLQTDVGIVEGRVNGRQVAVTVPGGGQVWPQRRLRVEGRDLIGTYVVVGVPFFVVLHDDPDDLPVRYLGRAIRNHPELQPAGANVDFVRVDEEQGLYFRVYERGVEDETLSSGTGSVAAALAAAAADRVASPVACKAAGGTLMVHFRPLPMAPVTEGAPVVEAAETEPNISLDPTAAETDEDSDSTNTADSQAEPADADEDAGDDGPEDPAPVVDEAPSLPRIAEGPPFEFVEIEVEGDTRRVMSGTATADAFKTR